jgi:hypothetical protein
MKYEEESWLGKVIVTQGVRESVWPSEVSDALDRLGSLDWGDVTAESKRANEEAMKIGLRVMSVWSSELGTTYWIITEADRSMTTVLLPDEGQHLNAAVQLAQAKLSR